MVEPANQELASTATPEPIHNNNTDIIEIDESTTIDYMYKVPLLLLLKLIVRVLLRTIDAAGHRVESVVIGPL